jgi:hypothetical protein
MINKVILRRVIVTVFSTALYTDTGIVYAFDMCNNMFDKMRQTRINQSEWRGENMYRDDYYGDPGVAPGYGSLRGRGYGYGSPGYGYGGPPASVYGYNVPAYAAPQPGNDALQAEIYQLKLRLKSLEKALSHESFQQQSAQTDSAHRPGFAGM